ncbi:hypothetical protein DO62_5809 [Burkholderia pseudomallei]|nr:hypothetical protein DO62_5809 [Burkholderia pseudomallei]
MIVREAFRRGAVREDRLAERGRQFGNGRFEPGEKFIHLVLILRDGQRFDIDEFLKGDFNEENLPFLDAGSPRIAVRIGVNFQACTGLLMLETQPGGFAHPPLAVPLPIDLRCNLCNLDEVAHTPSHSVSWDVPDTQRTVLHFGREMLLE